MDNKDQSAVKLLAAEWGWTNPPESVLKIAEQSLFAQKALSGEILVQWNLIDASTRDRLMKNKPPGIQTLEYIAEQEPVRVKSSVEQILALKNGYPFYGQLSLLTTHTCMSEPSVIKRCDELDAVVMTIDGVRTVVVFDKWDKLLKYSTLGKDAHNDALYKANGNAAPLLAVGARDEILSLLKTFHSNSGDQQADAGARVWYTEAPEMQTPEAKEVSRLVDHTVSNHGTDISFKPFRNGGIQVLIRKWGKLISPFKDSTLEGGQKGMKIVYPVELAEKVINLLAQHSGANPKNARKRVPSDGQITYRSSAADAFLRLNFLPLNHLGERADLRSVSIRVFGRTEQSIRLTDLNMPATAAEAILDAIRMPQGLILWSGPVNSGKSTGIAAAIGELVAVYGDEQKILSVEDPIERYVLGITQVNVPTHIENLAERYNVILRSIKRHDLNVLWVGEVRDKESAEFCVGFAGSGHLVFSTIHAKDSIVAYEILSYMVDPGIRFQLSESMALSINQRLVKTICPCCSKDIPWSPATDEERRRFKLNLAMSGESAELPAELPRANPQGCENCDEGYAETVPICEVLPFTREVKDAFISLSAGYNVSEQRRIIAAARTSTLLQSGLELLRDGRVDLDSILFY